MQSASIEVADMSSLVPERSTVKAWVVCLTAALFFFYEFVQLMMFNALNSSLMQAFHVTATATGKISSAYFIANIIFMFPAGILLDRFSTRKIILTAMLLCLGGTLLFSMSNSIGFAAFCRFLTGIGGSFPFLCCLRLASRWFPARRMALASGMMLTFAFLGGAAGQVPMTYLINLVGWRHALQIDALVGLVFTGCIYCLVQDYPEHYAKALVQKAKKVNMWLAVKSAVTNLQNWFFGLYTSMLNLPVMLLGAIWGHLYLVQVFHMNKVAASNVTSMIFYGAIFGSPAMGWISDRMGLRKLPMIIFGFISLGLMLFVMYAHHLNYLELLILFFLLGFMTSAQVITYPAIAESNSHAMSGSALGLASVLIMSAPAVFQPLFGWLMDWKWTGAMAGKIPLYSISDFHHGLMIMPIAFVVGIAMVFFARETHCSPNRRLESNEE